jgi:hypothetical protein
MPGLRLKNTMFLTMRELLYSEMFFSNPNGSRRSRELRVFSQGRIKRKT